MAKLAGYIRRYIHRQHVDHRQPDEGGRHGERRAGRHADSDHRRFGGNITGGGNLTKTGNATLDLSGNVTLSGNTTVAGGDLQVSGELTSPVTVDDGATLGGPGQITGAVTVAAGGTFSPGDPVTTVIGPLSF